VEETSRIKGSHNEGSKFSLFIEFLIGLLVLPAIFYYGFNVAVPYIENYVGQVEMFRYISEGLLVVVSLYLKKWLGIGFLVTFLFKLIFGSGFF